MPRMALSMSAWSSTSSTYSRLIRSYTSANSRASSHGRAAGLTAACADSLGRSASTPLVSAAENPKTAPATRAISVRDRVDIISSNPPVWINNGYYSHPSWVNPRDTFTDDAHDRIVQVDDQCTISMS